MRILLDNNVPIALKRHLSRPHNVLHCRDLGWQALANGHLVRIAEGRFDAMVTVDKNMPRQTSLAGLRRAVLVMDVKSNKVDEVLSLIDLIREALETAPPGEYT